MEIDYKSLCFELFGTTDVEKLKVIAQKNKRGAGRKKSVSVDQLAEMKQMENQGVIQREIAKHFGISRQTVSKYLKNELNDSYNYQIDFMYKNTVCTGIFVNFKEKKIKIINKTSDVLHCAFGVNETPDWNSFNEFLEERCFSKARGDRRELLKLLEIDSYDMLQIVERTKGKIYEDSQWLRFRSLDEVG